MLLLSIDTCASLGTVALARAEGDSLTLLGQTEIPGKTYSAQLVRSIRELLGAHHVAVADLAAIVVTSGPGSFTGIRIALSTAKGLAEAHGTPILAVSRLAVLAHQAGTAAAALDASRGEFYFGDYSGAARRESLLAPEVFREEAGALAASLGICEASVAEAAPQATRVAAPAAADALRFALPRILAGDHDDPALLDGNYLRRSDAEIFSKPRLVPQP